MLSDLENQALLDGVIALQALYRARNSGVYNQKRVETAISNNHAAVKEFIEKLSAEEQEKVNYEFPFLKIIGGKIDGEQ